MGKGEKDERKGGEKIADLCPVAGHSGGERREGRKEGRKVRREKGADLCPVAGHPGGERREGRKGRWGERR